MVKLTLSSSVQIRKSPLDYFGGYDVFHGTVYSQIKEAAEKLTLKESIEIKRRIGIDLVAILENKAPLLHNTIDTLQTILNKPINYPTMEELTFEEREYWQKESNLGSHLELYVLAMAIEELDKISKEKLRSN